jgi:hypothetical protein
MQARVRRSLLRQAYATIGKPLPPDPSEQRSDDFGFWTSASEALEMFMLFQHHGILPYQGGWYDQPPEVRYDLLNMLALYGKAVRDAKDKKSLPDPDAAERKTRWRPPSLDDLTS